jgi:8-oxo-dGTP pyrophosphatase MutT (NUDIX family)
MNMSFKHFSNRAFLEWIHTCNKLPREAFVPLMIQDIPLGGVHRDNLHLFRAYPDTFMVSNTSISLHPRLEGTDERSQAVEKLTRAWYAQGLLPTWRNEPYRVAETFDAAPLMLVERAAASLLGIQRYGVHLNGFVRKDDGLHMWVGQRSSHSPTYPNLFDQLVAGGVAAGFSPRHTLVKECEEEAGMAANLARAAKPAGVISYALEQNQRLVRDLLFIYDLELPTDFIPRNYDGEVSQFHLWPLEEIARRVANSHDFKLNTNLVIIDFLVRHGYLSPEDPNYAEICLGLHQYW